MALMVSGKVIKIKNKKAIVDVEGNLIEARLDFFKDIHPGDYVTVYYGIVLEKINKYEAEQNKERCSYIHSSNFELTFKVLNLKKR